MLFSLLLCGAATQEFAVRLDWHAKMAGPNPTIYRLWEFFHALPRSTGNKLAARGMLIVTVYAAVRSAVSAAAKPFWYDEVCTRIVALQANIYAIWNSLERGADGQPFGFYVVERAAAALLHNENIAFRAPSILAFCCTLLCLFAFVRLRSGGLLALLCASIALLTQLYTYFAVEARPYSLLVACIACALVCYQRAAKARWLLLLGVSLAMAEAAHYYAILAMLPFVIAEIAVLLTTRRIRFGVWIAFACGVVPLALLWKMLAALKQLYGEHFLAPPSLVTAVAIYPHIFRMEGALGFALAAALIAGVAVAALSRQIPETHDQFAPVAPIEEYVLICALLALPFIEFIVSKLMHGGLAYRYALPTILGLPLALGVLLPRLGRRVTFLAAAFLVCAFAAEEGSFWRRMISNSWQGEPLQDTVENLVIAADYPKLPVVVSDGVTYLYLAYYPRPQSSQRLAALVDPPAAIRYAGSDTVDQQLLVLRTLYPLQVNKYGEFASAHRQFLLYSGAASRFDWWLSRLAHDGDAIQLLADENGQRIYLVDLDRRKP
jgi:hypothetical protein